MLNQAHEDWDDSVIMKIFHDSIKRHRTVASQKSKNVPLEEPIKVPPIPAKVNQGKRKQVEFSIEEGEVVEHSSTSNNDAQTSKRSKQSDDNVPTKKLPMYSEENSQQDSNQQFYTQYASINQPQTYFSKEVLDEAQQTMLMAWYQSGYATGRYQLLCELAEQGYQFPSFPVASEQQFPADQLQGQESTHTSGSNGNV